MLTSEQIKEICAVQHKLYVCKAIMSKMPAGYTQADIDALSKDLQIMAKHEKYEEELNKLITKYGAEAIGVTFSDKEIMSNPENRFTFEDQRKATFEVIGKELTFEEVLEKYCNEK